MRKSASGVTVVITGGVVLFVGFGSIAGSPAEATFESTALVTGGVTVIVRLVTALEASTPRSVQTSWPPRNVAGGVALTKVTLAGRLSVTESAVVGDGPRLVTLI